MIFAPIAGPNASATLLAPAENVDRPDTTLLCEQARSVVEVSLACSLQQLYLARKRSGRTIGSRPLQLLALASNAVLC